MKKSNHQDNYLLKTPAKHPIIKWNSDENGIVTLEIENKGVFNLLAQKLFKKPKISYVHLDKFGSFVWSVTDGIRNISQIGESVKKQFGSEAEPLYERLAKYYQILYSYHFIEWK